MKLLVISDLHIADNEHLGTFGWNLEDFIGIVEAVRRDHSIDRVILNGDTFDLCKSNYRDIVSSHKQIIDYLMRIGSVFIKGNHDCALGYGQNHFGTINSKGEKIYIEHGHRADFINGTPLGRCMGNFFYRVLKLLARLSVTRTLYFGYLEHDEGFKGHGKYNSYKYLRYAVKLLRKYDMVVLGHTHKIEFHNTYWLNNRKRYINSGSCSFGRFQGIVIDTETLHHSTIRMDPPRPPSTVPAAAPHKAPRKKLRPFVNDGTLVPAAVPCSIPCQ
jgi:predicted phosphodiesterase